MTKEELKDYIKTIQLEKELEDLIFELVDGVPEVNDFLLKTIAHILSLYADVCEKTAEILEKEAGLYGQLAAHLELIEEEEYKDRLEVLKKSQESLLEELNKKILEFKSDTTQAAEGTKQIEEVKQVIQEASIPTTTTIQ